MTRREGVAAVLLWSVLVFVGTMFGASVYQRISLIPEWGGALRSRLSPIRRSPCRPGH